MPSPVSNAITTAGAAAARWRPALLTFVLALSVLKGLRMPNRWSVTQYIFTYDFGYVKRGLFGEVLSHVLGSWTSKYFVLAAVALALFAAVVYLIARATIRLPDSQEHLAFGLVFFASPAIAMITHLAGYLEQIAYLWILCLLLIPMRWRLQFAGAAAAAATLPFVHEASLMWAAPLTMLTVVVTSARDAPRPAIRFRAMAVILVLFALGTAMTLWLGSHTSRATAYALREDRTKFFDIRPRQDAFETLVRPLHPLRIEMQQRWSERAAQIDMALSIATFAPAAILLGVIAIRRARAIADPGTREVTLILVALTIVGPFLLHVIAWDRHRWNALTAFNAGMAALFLVRARSETVPLVAAAKPVGLGIALAVAFWSLASDPSLFDAYSPNHPPFTYQVNFLLEFLRTGNWQMWIPAVGN